MQNTNSLFHKRPIQDYIRQQDALQQMRDRRNLEYLARQEENIEAMLESLRESFTQAKFLACGSMLKRYIQMGGSKKVPFYVELNTIFRNRKWI